MLEIVKTLLDVLGSAKRWVCWSMKNKVIVANWKMNGSQALARELTASAFQLAKTLPAHIQLILCPPAVYIYEMAQALKSSPVAVGAQNCHTQISGAFTGELSASQLGEAGAKYVIVGHSERRKYFGETNADVLNKAKIAITQQLIPIICVGESLEERQQGNAQAVVQAQLEACVPVELASQSQIILAYEPIWAIGSGQIPSVAEIASMHQKIGEWLFANTGRPMPVIYGGSVNAENAREILKAAHVHGVLVGGASLKAESFEAIARATP